MSTQRVVPDGVDHEAVRSPSDAASPPTTGMAVGSVTAVDPVAAPPTRRRRLPGRPRSLVVASVVAVVVVGVLWWPEPGPPALVPDAVGATPRAPSGSVAWRWTLPQEGSVQYLDVVEDRLLVLDLHRPTTGDDAPPTPVQRLRSLDVVDGVTRWQHRMLGNEAVVLVDDRAGVTTVVPTALGSPAVVVALDMATGLARWRVVVDDVDGIDTDGGRIVAHGDRGCVVLDPSDGTPLQRLDGGRCLPWGTTLARSGPDGWELWGDGEAVGPPVPGSQPPVALDDGVVVATDRQVVATTLGGAPRWQVRTEEPARVVRPFPSLGVRVDGLTTSTILSAEGRLLAEVPWWYRGVVDERGLVFLDVPTGLDRTGPPVVRVVGGDGQVLAATDVDPEATGIDPVTPGVAEGVIATSASVAVAARVAPSMFCPPVAVTCRARRWPAVRLTADGVLMESSGTLALHDLRTLAPRWEVDLDGASVDALAAGRRGVVALVTGPEGRTWLRGYA
ncbi:hypothetical protein [Salsipaludibacter albus]|uniref:hypothetical protein n=1 Tax=Salsipaludibacter albus TaxID=2849650 RepID=UPI001EE4B5DB|nr:hypothetical protein [Salsipaludibacter albus]MBY5163070.1 hypothetical protein [Salsipaludibacter albus]